MNENSIFHEAIAKPPAERAAFLDRVCAGQPQLRSDLDALLAAHEATGTLPDGQVSIAPQGTGEFTPEANEAPQFAAKTTDYSPNAETGAVIAGRYVLQEKIGEGGMGEVWVAKQTEPVKRRVAIKLIKPGMDSKAVLARFDQERQALAMMDHPNIAKVLDGGLTADRRPFFVMELVNGLPLTKYCDEAKLSIRDRLELFVPICQAVQHAHQKGIIHRDLKPSNILVTLYDGHPAPKVIDFGVAKATAGKIADDSLSTQFGAVVGTYEYMAPEQAGFSALDVDTRADIYALGVILYELLTGLRPFDGKRLRKAALDEMIRIIREEEPPRPSTRLSTNDSLPSLAAIRQMEPKKLTALMRGELDWVVMKCLQKQREQRYETANGLARDVQRFLANEPVEARPPSAGYRFGKFLKRNRGPVLAASLVLLSLLGGIAGTTWSLLEARKQKGQAEQAADAERDAHRAESEQRREAEKQHAAAVAEKDRADHEARTAKVAHSDMNAFGNFLIEDVLAVARPKGQQGGMGIGVTVVDALTSAEPRLKDRFRGQPRAEALARQSIGVTWRTLGKLSKAEFQLRQAVELRRQHLGPDDPLTLNSMNSLATALNDLGRHKDALPIMEELLKHQDKKNPTTTVFMHNMAATYWADGQLPRCVKLFEETYELRKELLGPDDPLTLMTLANLAAAYHDSDQLDRALPIYREVLDKTRDKLGPKDPNTLHCMSILVIGLKDKKQLREALSLAKQVVTLREEVLSPAHPDTCMSIKTLGECLLLDGQRDEAVKQWVLAVERLLSVNLIELPVGMSVLKSLAEAYTSSKEHEKAIRVITLFIAGKRKMVPADSPILADVLGLLSVQLLANKQFDQAETQLRECLTIQEKKEPDVRKTARTKSRLGGALLGQKKFADAQPLLLTAYEGLKLRDAKASPESNEYAVECLERLVQLYEAWGKPDEAAKWRKELKAVLEGGKKP